jgi:hypothetical protein
MSQTTPHLQWTEGEPPAEILSGAHLDELLDGLAAEARPDFPTAVRLHAHECEVDVILGLANSCVYVDEPGPRQYHMSVGDPHAEGTTEFYLLGSHHTEWENRYFIPLATARRVVREFFDTGRRSASIQWEEGCY